MAEWNRASSKAGLSGARRRVPGRREQKVLIWALAVLVAILADAQPGSVWLPPEMHAIPYLAKDVLAAAFLARLPRAEGSAPGETIDHLCGRDRPVPCAGFTVPA
jgi:hypothetical protein